LLAELPGFLIDAEVAYVTGQYLSRPTDGV
jgi:hypothetical protein